MSDEPAFIAAICATPDDDAPRLVFADWLDESGQPERAEFIRVQCRLAEGPPGFTLKSISFRGDTIDGETDWSQPPPKLGGRVAVRCLGGPEPHLAWVVSAGICSVGSTARTPGNQSTFSLRFVDCDPVRRWELDEQLRSRSDSLLSENADNWVPRVNCLWNWHRGFVRSLTCTAADCLAHLGGIRALHPVEEVRLTDLPRIGPMLDSGGLWTFGPYKVNNATLDTSGEQMPIDDDNPRYPGVKGVRRRLLEAQFPGIKFHLPHVGVDRATGESYSGAFEAGRRLALLRNEQAMEAFLAAGTSLGTAIRTGSDAIIRFGEAIAEAIPATTPDPPTLAAAPPPRRPTQAEFARRIEFRHRRPRR